MSRVNSSRAAPSAGRAEPESGSASEVDAAVERRARDLMVRDGWGGLRDRVRALSVPLGSAPRQSQLLSESAVRRAVREPDLPVLEFLLARGVSPTAQSRGTHTTAMHEATRVDVPLDVMRTLIDSGADLDVQDRRGDTPLHDAVTHGNLPMVRLLIEQGARLDIQNDVKRTPRQQAERLLAYASGSRWAPSPDILAALEAAQDRR